jgi:hypothetical protein
MEAKIKRPCIWKRLKARLGFAPVFSYPIVYSDGYISRLKSDFGLRTPHGILIGRWIVLLFEPSKMCYNDGSKFCKNLYFAGEKGRLPSIYLLKYIKRNFNKINDLILSIDGAPIEHGYYLSSELDKEFEYHYTAVRMNTSDVVLEYALHSSEKANIRPVFHL